ncbi:hypothetical protein [Carboxylicivirga linearis]|uniref:Outer membrane protein beta-barrel domain-containing protein n=1 Tax=Carboxylicivirga linearis TaxID=1628157 RepID=A0ABS5K153_9BACT|nr:hypothetical protein [Carboxylicivirga linearis]MBS2100426.1 hypothetical protein [Carboxylicivirga linearis]
MKRYYMWMLLLAIVVLGSNEAVAQQPEVKPTAPIPLEVFLGGEGFTSQLVLDRKFGPDSKLGFFGLTYINANYENDGEFQESVNLSMLKYDVLKGVSVLAGSMYNSHWGFRPFAGAQYAYHTRTFMGMLTSGFHLTATKNFETIAMLEYRPVIKGDWSLYSRVQGMYSHITTTSSNHHDRSHVYGRLGVSFKNYSFGAAYNYDCYSPMKITNNEFGIFIGVLM